MARQRYRISGLTVLMVLVAYDGTALSWVIANEVRYFGLSPLLGLVALPWANLLVYAALPWICGNAGSGKSFRFRAGFAWFGLIALVVFLACAFRYSREIYSVILAGWGGLLDRNSLGGLLHPYRPWYHYVVALTCLSTMTGAAMLGGYLAIQGWRSVGPPLTPPVGLESCEESKDKDIESADNIGGETSERKQPIGSS